MKEESRLGLVYHQDTQTKGKKEGAQQKNSFERCLDIKEYRYKEIKGSIGNTWSKQRIRKQQSDLINRYRENNTERIVLNSLARNKGVDKGSIDASNGVNDKQKKHICLDFKRKIPRGIICLPRQRQGDLGK